jgi:hypothetical protein
MARRSKIAELPSEVIDDLNSKLIERGFSGYEDLVHWLKDMGYDISKSSLHRHGSALENEFSEAMADARRTRALARAARESEDGDGGELLEAASGIMQDNLLRLSLKLKNSEGKPEDAAKTLSLISRAFADIGRFDISRQKWQAENEARIRSEERQKAADAVAASAKQLGVSLETIEAIRRDVLGMIN